MGLASIIVEVSTKVTVKTRVDVWMTLRCLQMLVFVGFDICLAWSNIITRFCA